MVSLRLHKYELDIPQIGKIVSLNTLDVTVEWWIGSYSSTWIQWKEKGTVIEETFPRNAILTDGIEFTKSHRLTKACVKKLKEAYNSHELI